MKFNKQKLFLLILFIASTIFFIYQHAAFIGWDFAAYVLNAKYLFSHGFYYEWFRAPLMPLLVGAFSYITFGNYLAAEFLYIIVASGLFFWSTLLLAKRLKINPLIFYALLLSPFLLVMGLIEGTELLTLALIMFSLYFVFSEKKYASIWAGLLLGVAAIARFGIYLLIFLFGFEKKAKRIATSFGCFLIPSFFWAMFTLIKKHSVMISFADNYGLNSYFRDYIMQPIKLSHILLSFNYYYIVFFALGIFFLIKELKSKKKIFDRNKKDLFLASLLMVVFFALGLYTYASSHIKVERYTFFLVLPIAFFSTFFFENIKKKKVLTIALIVLVLVNFTAAILVFHATPPRSEFKKIADSIPKDCMAASDEWVYLNYFGLTTAPITGDQEQVFKDIQQGKRFVIFFGSEPLYLKNETFLNKLPIIQDKGTYWLVGNSSVCMEPYVYDKPYLQDLRERNVTRLTNCQVMMPKQFEFWCQGRKTEQKYAS